MPPNEKINTELLTSIIKNNKNTIILGDFNAKHELWYCKSTDSKGKDLEQLINTHDLVIQNNSTLTFIYSDNILDLTLSSKEICSRIYNFNTNNSITSDELMITANLKCDISFGKSNLRKNNSKLENLHFYASK